MSPDVRLGFATAPNPDRRARMNVHKHARMTAHVLA